MVRRVSCLGAVISLARQFHLPSHTHSTLSSLDCLMASGGALRQSEPHLLSHYCYLSSSDDTPSIHPHFHSLVTISSSQVKAFIVNKNEDWGVGKCNRGDNGDQSKSYTCLKMLKQNPLFCTINMC